MDEEMSTSQITRKTMCTVYVLHNRSGKISLFVHTYTNTSFHEKITQINYMYAFDQLNKYNLFFFLINLSKLADLLVSYHLVNALSSHHLRGKHV